MSDAALFIGRAEVRVLQRQLFVDGESMPVGARAFDLLLALLDRPGRLVSKRELFQAAWPDTFVEPNNLTVQISVLRKALGAGSIVTIPGRGYRLAVLVQEQAAPEPVAAGHASASDAGFRRRTNLPRCLPPLFGREDDLMAVVSALQQRRMVTLVGTGGVGKSRLAQAVAHTLLAAWPDSVQMVEFASLADPEHVPHLIAQVLEIPLDVDGAPWQELANALAHRRLLLVLDNCEHLIEAVARQAQALLLHAPEVTMLATSQIPLRLADEQQFRVAGLAVAPPGSSEARHCGALRLFEARGRATDPQFCIADDDIPIALEVCRRLDGLPLAIELASVRAPLLGVRGLNDKLDERFRLLIRPSRTSPLRQQTLYATLEWSHQSLSADEKVVFRRLGVFSGGFTMALAQAVVADADIDEWAVLDHLDALVDRSLVVLHPGDSPRFSLLESTRAFAIEQSTRSGDAEASQRQHALTLSRLLDSNDASLLDGDEPEDRHATRLRPEVDNLRSARHWAAGQADIEFQLRLNAQASTLDEMAADCLPWLITHRDRVEAGVDAATAARFWLALCDSTAYLQLPKPMQLAAAERAEAMYLKLGRPRRAFRCLLRRARCQLSLGDVASAEAAIANARALLDENWPMTLLAALTRIESHVARRTGRHGEALPLFHEAVRLSHVCGDWSAEVNARNNLADFLWEMGSLAEAATIVQQLLADLGMRPSLSFDHAIVLANAMGILAESGQTEAAVAVGREALSAIPPAQWMPYLTEISSVLWRAGRLEAAATALGASSARLDAQQATRDLNGRRQEAMARPALIAALGAERFALMTQTGRAMVTDPAALRRMIVEALAD